jgi:hypothetical protein
MATAGESVQKRGGASVSLEKAEAMVIRQVDFSESSRAKNPGAFPRRNEWENVYGS